MKVRAGDYVAIRSAHEIEATLDDDGCLDGLPFMPEMAHYCGTFHQVHKRVDKIIDIIENTGLRRMSDTVTLVDLRCDGSAHRGCQSGCQMLWKDAWLRRCTPREMRNAQPAAGDTTNLLSRLKTVLGTPPDEVHRCQATSLFKASNYLHRWDPRQYLEPLWFGNVKFLDFVRVISLSLFNSVQRLRKGCEYPHWVGSTLEKTPTADLGLQQGEWVRVKTKNEILATLDRRNRNRGLWFDREMLRFCGSRLRVLRRVERLIEEKSGKLLEIRNPSVILEGATASGEFYRFNPQNDYVLWREIWLERLNTQQDGGVECSAD